MECLDFDDMSTLDLIAGMGVSPDCTPIKPSHRAAHDDDDEVFEGTKLTRNVCLVKPPACHTAFTSQPSILRRGKHRRNRGTANGTECQVLPREHEGELFDMEVYVDKFQASRQCTAQVLETTPAQTTPIRLPHEHLPFSPSQFMTSLCQSSCSDVTSTPGMSQNSYYYTSINCSDPLTPRHQVGRQSTSPHTPTPFKHAMAEVERRAQSKLWTPGDLDDLGKVLKECDTGYEADQSSGFTPTSQAQQSKRRFSREPAHHEKAQKKSAKKIVFTDSPLKETAKTAMLLDPSYEQVACGLTKDQMDMTQLAKKYYL